MTKEDPALSTLVFQLGEEVFAFTAKSIQAVVSHRPVHALPCLSSQLLKGLIPYEGKAEPFVSLYELLQIQPSLPSPSPIMLALSSERGLWLFDVTAVLGLHLSFPSEITPFFPDFSVCSPHYLKGHFLRDGHRVGLLDETLIISALERSVL